MTPLQLQNLSKPLVGVYIDIENELMADIAKRLDSGAGLGTAEWRAERLAELSALNKSSLAILRKKLKGVDKRLLETLKEAGNGNLSAVDKTLRAALAAKLIKPAALAGNAQSAAAVRILSAYYQNAKDKLNLANANLLINARSEYINIINKTAGRVLLGVDAPQAALRRSVREFAAQGIPAMTDKAGRKWTPEAYVDNVIRSTSNNVANDMQFARMDEYGVDLVEVSSHMGARPKCEPYQGRIFSRSGKSKKYPAWAETSYGDAGGLLGCNCRHSVYPFVEGVSVQRYEPQDKEKNAEAYANSQKQRLIERGIRAAKREKEMFDALGDSEGSAKAAQKIKGKQAQMREFINETGLPRQRHREQIYA